MGRTVAAGAVDKTVAAVPGRMPDADRGKTVGIIQKKIGICLLYTSLKSLKPVEKIKAGASQLAHGNDENRIQLAGKDELAKLASDFNAMAEAIETNMLALHDKTEQLSEKTERQQAFINDLSHEMKTPVTSILLNAEMLLSRKVTEEVLEKSLEHIYSQAKWLERLSQKLMTLILLQRGIQLEEESVEALLEDVYKRQHRQQVFLPRRRRRYAQRHLWLPCDHGG